MDYYTSTELVGGLVLLAHRCGMEKIFVQFLYSPKSSIELSVSLPTI